MTVVLIRHAQTEWSKAKRHTGRTDLPLLEEGREHAAGLPARLAEWDFATVLCSPLRRAQETAELAGLRERAQLHAGLLEWDYGDYEGITSEEIHRDRPDWWLWEDGAPGGESPADVAARVDGAIADVLAAEPEGPVAVVAHGHLLRAFAARWCEQPIAFGGRLKLGVAAICVLGEDHGRRAITRWNET